MCIFTNNIFDEFFSQRPQDGTIIGYIDENDDGNVSPGEIPFMVGEELTPGDILLTGPLKYCDKW